MIKIFQWISCDSNLTNHIVQIIHHLEVDISFSALFIGKNKSDKMNYHIVEDKEGIGK